MVYVGDYPTPGRFEAEEAPAVASSPSQEVVVEAEEEKSFFEKKGLLLLLGLAFLFRFNYINLQWFVGLSMIVVAWGAWEFGKKFVEEKKTVVYKPFDLSELPEIEHEIMVETGRRIELSPERMRAEPETGRRSAEPYAMHFKALETLQNGRIVPTHVSISLMTPKKRAILSIEKDLVGIETNTKYWTGNIKPQAYQPIPETRETIFMPTPTPISATPTEEEEEEEKQKEENKK